MKTVTHNYSFKDIKISPEHIYQLMGYKEEPVPDPYPQMVHDELAHFEEYCCIQGGYTLIQQPVIDVATGTVFLDLKRFEVGKKIAIFLKEAEHIAIFACTAGKKIEERSKQLMKDGHLLEGYIVDLLGSVTVETAMDHIHQQLIDDMSHEGLGVSNRYSPGYCSWAVSEQKTLFSFLPPDFCGISLSDSCLMNPIKSVSGMIAIGEKVKYKGYICDLCNSTNCIYRDSHKDLVV
jgi:hypothetical protein